MRKKKQNRSSEFKAIVAIEALKEQKTISALAQIYEIYPNQISIWKKEFLDNVSLVFGKTIRDQKRMKWFPSYLRLLASCVQAIKQ